LNSCVRRFLVIVGDLDVIGVVTAPNKANSELVIDSDAVLTLPVPPKLFQSVPGRESQVLQFGCAVEHCQLALGNSGGRRTSGLAGAPDFRRRFVGEALDHFLIIMTFVNNVNRYELPYISCLAVLYSLDL